MLIEAIIEKYGYKEGLVESDNKIVSWPYEFEKPSDEELTALCNAFEAKRIHVYKRIQAYPGIDVQLDILFHEGYEGWKARIQEVKDKYPKPE